jgi:hypothetical protein
MRSANRLTGRALRAGLLALAAGAAVTPALAGGPLFVVPSGGTLKPARWQGVVNVYTDLGDLGATPNAAVTKVVEDALAQWSSVPNSTFRAKRAGQLPYDVTGANADKVIGSFPGGGNPWNPDTSNGGGIQVVYDGDDSVIADFMGAGYGVLGIASPEYLAGDGSTQIVEGWVIIGGQWLNDPSGEAISGVVTHEFGHAINLAHSQTNGFYAANQGYPDWGIPDGLDQAGPDQCGRAVPVYPAASDIETMYPMIDPRADSPRYNSPQMATVDIADDRAALASIYPAAGYAASTGTLRGRVVAKDGTSQLTGVNVIARRVDQGRPFDAMSRISGDLTQGLLGADGDFVMTGLVPGASYVVHIDEVGRGGFSTPKAMLLGPEEYWNTGESGDASVDDACASTPITVAAGEVRQIRIAVNGIPRAPTFTHIPYVLVSNLSDNGQQLAGVYSTFQSPFWTWDKTNGQSYLGGSGFLASISGNGRVVGGTVGVPVMTDWGSIDQERAALWTKSGGWKSIAGNYEGCGGSQSTPYDLSTDGSTAVGLAFVDCRNAYAFKWNARTGMKLLPKVSENAQCQDPWSGDIYECEGAARANAVSANGGLVGGWEEIPEAGGNRIGSIWQGNEQMLLRDPGGDNAMGGWVGEVMGVNSAGTIAVGVSAGKQLKDAYQWTSSKGVTSLGRYPVTICYFDWWTWQDVCDDPETAAFSVSDDGKVITGAVRLPAAGIDEGAIYTPKMGWMPMAEFLQRQGVLEASRWQILGANVSAQGKTLAGTALPLAADYYQGFRLELDQVYVCHGKGSAGNTLRVGFPDSMDQHLSHGDAVGFCPGQGPI